MSHEKTISDLAYHLWHARGCPPGSPEVDWAEAERQVKGRAPAANAHTPEALPAADEAAAAGRDISDSLATPKKSAKR